MPSLSKESDCWRVTWSGRGGRKRRRFQSEADAIKFMRSLGEPNNHKGSSLAVDLHEYIRWSEQDKKKSPAWVKTSAQMIGEFVNHINVTRTTDITANHVRKYRTWFATKTDRKDSTWEKYRQSISAFLNWANRRDPNVTNHAGDPDLKVQVQLNPPDTLEPDEVKRILKYFDSQDNGRRYPMGTAFRILLYTGIRLGEFTALRWRDVDLNAKTLSVGTKTKEARTVPVCAALEPFLLSLPTDAEYVFDDGRGEPRHHRKTYYQALQRACAVMGIKKHSVHSIRHTFVRNLLEAGVELTLVSKLCGHKDIRTTMRYAAHFNLTNAREAVESLRF